jgi:soluble lytic murein transglycosylase-like protein
MAMIESESSGKPKAKNGGCVGIMQINKRFHEERMERLDITDLYDEKQNILVGTDYLSELFAEYEDVYMVLMAYNMGQSNAEKLFNDGVYESEYARKICERSAELEQIHGK